jgi:hypothetical protein
MGKPLIDTEGRAAFAVPTISERAMWTGFAAVPAGLGDRVGRSAVLWVAPLSLYLLSFVAIFRDRAWVPHRIELKLVPFAVAVIATGSFLIRLHWGALIVVHLASFVVLTLGDVQDLGDLPAQLRWMRIKSRFARSLMIVRTFSVPFSTAS